MMINGGQPMRFLHLSDLHIGKSVNGFSMIAEQKNTFAQIIELIKIECPTAVIIAGDVYDRAIPGVEAVRVFDDFLTGLAGTDVTVLLISGNHDSPERINYASRLLTDKHLYFYGAFDGAVRKVILSDEHGEVNFWLLPFVKPATARGMFGDKEIESYDDIIAAAIEAADIDYTARNVLVSHQFYTKSGVSPIRSESELNPVGGLDAVDAGIIENFDYIALGHLHGGQAVGSEHIRYCGSPVKYSFSEWRQEKSVTLVDIGEKGSLAIKPRPIVPIHDMREIKGRIDTLMSGDVSRLADKEDYLRVILTDEDEIIDPIGKLRSVYTNIMSLDFENSRTNIDATAITTNMETMEKLSAYELFGEFFLEVQGSTMTQEQAEIVRELLERPDEE
jgi:exonuclease SbcD